MGRQFAAALMITAAQEALVIGTERLSAGIFLRGRF
jgi:hypothetical protein